MQISKEQVDTENRELERAREHDKVVGEIQLQQLQRDKDEQLDEKEKQLEHKQREMQSIKLSMQDLEV